MGRTRELISDPEVTLHRAATGEWTPLAMVAPLVHVVTVETGDVLRLLLPSEHAKLVKFVEVWMRNVDTNLLQGNVLEGEIEDRAAYAAE